jgi:hypothetical protein
MSLSALLRAFHRLSKERRPARGAAPAGRPRTAPLRLENLEGRAVPSTFQLVHTYDAGARAGVTAGTIDLPGDLNRDRNESRSFRCWAQG